MIKKLVLILAFAAGLQSQPPPSQQSPQNDLKQQIGKIIVTPGAGPSTAIADFVSRNERAAEAAEIISKVLYDDLSFAGATAVVGKSLYPTNKPADPSQVDFSAWGADPVRADYLAFGNVNIVSDELLVESYLYDLQAKHRLLSVQTRFPLNQARYAAHKIADEIVKLLAGFDGIATSRIAFVSGRSSQSDIFIMDYDGANVRRVTNDRSINLFPNWSSDGRKLAYISFQTGVPNIHIKSIADGATLPFPHFSRGTTLSPALSSDGKLIAFCSSKDSRSTQLYVANADGSGLRQLTNDPPVIHSSARWNPRTGRDIAFISNRSGSPQIYAVDVDGSNLRRLLDKGGFADSPSWSPDGRYIAFTWRPPSASRFDIYVMDAATQQIIQLTDGPGDNESPSWSPDGRHIAFQSSRSGRFEVYLMHIDGTGVKQVTTAGGRSPAWSR
jgi:TolB protein